VQLVCVVFPGRSGGPEAPPAWNWQAPEGPATTASLVAKAVAGHATGQPSRVIVADSTTTAAWFALGGVLLTSLFALATTLLSHRLQTQNAERALHQEQLRQLRQERREAYVQYWSSWNRFIHALRELSQEMRHQELQHDPRVHLARTAPGIAERAWTTEREWREAADALLLIGGVEVVQAAREHIAVTQGKLEAAWLGSWHADEAGTAYQRLNDAMRADLLPPI
jgi:urease accessory protein UreF